MSISSLGMVVMFGFHVSNHNFRKTWQQNIDNMALCMTLRRQVQNLTRKTVTVQPVRFRWKPPNKDEFIYPSFAQCLAGNKLL